MINAREQFPRLPAEDYPWQPVEVPGLLHRDGYRPVPTGGAAAVLAAFDDGLRTLRRPLLQRRTPVLAVGSNRCAEVLRTKLGRAGVSRTVPMLPCSVDQLAIGHLARVSLRGYLAAAPLHRPGARSAMVIGWLDDDQLVAIDDTEPGYDRVALPPADYPVWLTDEDSAPVRADALGIGTVSAYVARHQLLARVGDGEVQPLLLTSQAAIHRLLAGVPGLVDLDWRGAAAEIAMLLATDELRERVPRVLADCGLTLDAGIGRSAPG